MPQPLTQTQTEVVHQLEFVQDADCQFDRNGTFYNGKDARADLEMKYQYLSLRKSIDNAEDFIEKAATKSSFSGKPY